MRPETVALSADVDPELERQLAQAAANEPIEVVLLLRQYDNVPPMRATVAALLKRVCRDKRTSDVESTYLPRMGALIVRTYPQIIRRLIAQPEVEIACANRGESRVASARSSQATR